MAGRSPARPLDARSGRSPLTRRRRGAAPRAGTLQGLAEDGVQIGGESRAAGPAAEPPPRTKSAESRPEGGWACGPELTPSWGLPRNKGKIDYPRRKRI